MSDYTVVYVDTNSGEKFFLDKAINSGVAQFKYTQNVDAAVWTLFHKQSSDKFVLKITDDNGNKIYPNSVTIFDKDTITIEFSSPIKGQVIVIFFGDVLSVTPTPTLTPSITPSSSQILNPTPSPTPTPSQTPSIVGLAGTVTALAAPPGYRSGSSGGVINRELYTFGGSDSSNVLYNTLWKYTPDTNTWTVLQPGATTRQDHAAAACNGNIYIHGGSTSGGYTNDLWCYNSTTTSWTQLTSGGEICFYHTMVSISGKLYLFGGFKTGTYYNSLWCYDPALDSWTKLSSGPTGRYGHAATVLDGKMYIHGGVSSTTQGLSDLWCYDPVADTWTNLASSPAGYYYHAAAGINGNVYIAYGDLSSYDVASNSWTSISTTSSVSALQSTYGVIDNDFYYTTTGTLDKIT